MRVISINDKWVRDLKEESENRPSPHFLEECFVTKQKMHEGNIWYQLGGRFNHHSGFMAKFFAILPDASADEMKEETREAIVNIETQPV